MMVTIVQANNGTGVIKVRFPLAGLPIEKIYKQSKRYGLHSALEVDGVFVNDDDTVFAEDRLVYIPQLSAAQAEGMSTCHTLNSECRILQSGYSVLCSFDMLWVSGMVMLGSGSLFEVITADDPK
ncbi:hypothetical protein SELMODRAFT_429079 [Selaginella moellendorffii]|uniref:Uncharacterized protein n=1 Tax=Selaginella moellendorffii TaxID=88036 RepID=D8T500_SELML|nr:hypothetical protein SELMODRAFT_429079 [Selaginella moellendorffii]